MACFSAKKRHGGAVSHGQVGLGVSWAPRSTRCKRDIPESWIRWRRGATHESKACGPDGLAPVHLKHLGGLELCNLTRMINLSL